jgi:hypothetical protein
VPRFEEACGSVDEANSEYGLHDEAGEDETLVRNPGDRIDSAGERDSEYEHEEQRGEHVPDDREAPDLEKADDLPLEQPEERRTRCAKGLLVGMRREDAHAAAVVRSFSSTRR